MAKDFPTIRSRMASRNPSVVHLRYGVSFGPKEFTTLIADPGYLEFETQSEGIFVRAKNYREVGIPWHAVKYVEY